MALSYRVLFRAVVGLTSLETAVGYLNKYDKKYDHLRLRESVLSCFKGRMLTELESIADFKQTWGDLDSLMRVAIDTGLKKDHHDLLVGYCTAEDHGRWRGIGETAVDLEYTNVWEGERGINAIAEEVWEDLQIGLFSSVWDVVSGREEILECVVEDRYCRNLFVVGHRRQEYCDPACRKADGMRKVRLRKKERFSGKSESILRV
ncbi:TPA: hypothetical protein EYN98_25275 [Candidatus Poribacteria bacterium]|nr:hypothetical protein [Candidatus Poribacteria bacterium]HIA69289.1 hypothetical protein [Candidatus Poribacteria bacterium]HIC03291.1 hypothetical protein [Candidatus Poribacteria bacterium]HIC19603.1 hypothetical protein [Candidatus Poribacteria bacterium]HIM10524.1 hypothetical protein [Candidatus Poribacteria bacterium]